MISSLIKKPKFYPSPGSGLSRRVSYLILSVVLQSDGEERLEGFHVFLEIAAQN